MRIIGISFNSVFTAQVIHRDLAARNVLLATSASGDRLVAKICDFGLAKNRCEYSETEYMSSGKGCNHLPWR